MGKLTEFIDGFDIGKDVQPVSFSFHCEVGRMIEDNESNINTTRLDKKVPAPQSLVPFIP